MKKEVILLILIISVPLSYAKVVDIPGTNDGPGSEDRLGVKKFVYAGSNILASVENSQVKYYHQDRLSNRITTESSGQLDEEFKSLPFGQKIENSGVDYPFTGKEEDESGLYYFGARYYDDNLGRFTSVDPISEEQAYSYVGNNPIMYSDPDGRLKVPSWMRESGRFLKDNMRPALTTLAIGSVGYTLSSGNGPMSNDMSKYSAYYLAGTTIYALGASTAGQRYLPENVWDSEDIADPSELNSLIDEIGERSGPIGEEIGRRYSDFISKGGTLFLPSGGRVSGSRLISSPDDENLIIELDILRVGLPRDLSTGGMHSSAGDGNIMLMLVTPEVEQNFIDEYAEGGFKIDPELVHEAGFRYNALILGHELHHSTQNRWNMFTNSWWGFDYGSRFNSLEQPARDFHTEVSDSIK
jgi:RHS repeat-associated protein